MFYYNNMINNNINNFNNSSIKINNNNNNPERCCFAFFLTELRENEEHGLLADNWHRICWEVPTNRQIHIFMQGT